MKVVLVSSSSNGLSQYLSSKPGIDLIERYQDLYSVRSSLYNRLLVADRLLYVCTAETENFTRDLNTIGDLLENYGQLFKFDEIIFYVESSTKTKNYPDYIRATMGRFPKQKCTIPISDFKISFSDTYNVLLGRTDAVLNTEAREKVYIKQRGSKVQNIYDSDNKKITLEPFNYKSVQEYDELKETITENDSNTLIQTLDSNEINITQKYKDPYLGEFKFKQNLGERNIVLLTGNPANGTTTYLNGLALSVLKANKKSLAINMGYDNDFNSYLKVFGDEINLKFNSFNTRDLLLRESVDFSTNKLMTYSMHDLSDGAKVDALKYFIQHSSKCHADYIIIEVPMKLVREVSRILRHRLLRILCVSESVKEKLDNSIDLIKELSGRYTVELWVNNQARVRYESDWLSFGEVVERVPGNIVCHEEYILDSYDVDTEMFYEFVEVE